MHTINYFRAVAFAFENGLQVDLITHSDPHRVIVAVAPQPDETWDYRRVCQDTFAESDLKSQADFISYATRELAEPTTSREAILAAVVDILPKDHNILAVDSDGMIYAYSALPKPGRMTWACYPGETGYNVGKLNQKVPDWKHHIYTINNPE